jgi:apolipoprotein N-acyltransferase
VPRLRLRARTRLPAALTISLTSGISISLAFPPAGAWPVALVALMPLLWLLDEVRPRRGFALGLAFGLGFFGCTLYWIFDFGLAAWTGLTVVSAASIAVFGLAYPLVCLRGRPLLSALGAAALWTVMDRLRGLWPLGGFTWGSIGVSQVSDRALLRVASAAGVWGVTFAVVLVNALLLAALTDGGGGRRVGRLGLAVGVVFAPLLIPFPIAQGPPIDVATVQVDVREARSISSGSGEDLAVANLNIREYGAIAAHPPALGVWGEGALDPGASADPATMTDVRNVISQVGAPTLIGAVTDDADGRERTDVLLFGGNGTVVDRYDKVHLVPFGEYVPWRHELSWFRAIDQVPVDRAPGDRIHTLSTDDLPAFGTPICFENAFPEIPRAFVREGAEFLVVTVNNASYGFTAASAQHEQMSRMRAVETGRWVVNAAVSGISAFIDPSGRVTQRLGLFQTGILRGTIRSSSAMTLYVRFGDWVPYLSILLVAGLVLTPRRRRRALPEPEPLPSSGTRTLAVLPTYDERGTIEDVVRGVLAAPGALDVLVVDDSSPDGTADAVRAMIGEFGSRLRLRERPAKSGLASAYLEGFALALDEGYDLIVEMDSDLSHDPTELGSLLAAAARADLVVGSRYIDGGAVTNWSRSRVALSRAGNLYARLMLGIPLHDATSGYRVYRRSLLDALVSDPFRADGYGFQIELVMRAWNLGYALAESPITFRERTYGESKISRRIIVEALWLVTKWGIRDRLRGDVPSEPVPRVDPP